MYYFLLLRSRPQLCLVLTVKGHSARAVVALSVASGASLSNASGALFATCLDGCSCPRTTEYGAGVTAGGASHLSTRWTGEGERACEAEPQTSGLRPLFVGVVCGSVPQKLRRRAAQFPPATAAPGCAHLKGSLNRVYSVGGGDGEGGRGETALGGCPVSM